MCGSIINKVVLLSSVVTGPRSSSMLTLRELVFFFPTSADYISVSTNYRFLEHTFRTYLAWLHSMTKPMCQLSLNATVSPSGSKFWPNLHFCVLKVPHTGPKNHFPGIQYGVGRLRKKQSAWFHGVGVLWWADVTLCVMKLIMMYVSAWLQLGAKARLLYLGSSTAYRNILVVLIIV